MKKLLSILEIEMKRPTNYGWFHLMFVFLVILVTVFLCFKFKNISDKGFRRIVLFSWITMVILEGYKQFVFSYSLENSIIEWEYQWYAFPYQFCSTPLYVLPFIVFLKEGSIRDSFILYISTFSLFGGLAVFLYPNDVFIDTIGVNIQTMVHHGLQIILGIYFIVYARKKFNLKNFLGSTIVFMVLGLIAILLNCFAYTRIEEEFNMFFISPYYNCTLPILSQIYPKVSYSAFVFIYVFGFAMIALLIYAIGRGSLKITSLRERRNAKI